MLGKVRDERIRVRDWDWRQKMVMPYIRGWWWCMLWYNMMLISLQRSYIYCSSWFAYHHLLTKALIDLISRHDTSASVIYWLRIAEPEYENLVALRFLHVMALFIPCLSFRGLLQGSSITPILINCNRSDGDGDGKAALIDIERLQ